MYSPLALLSNRLTETETTIATQEDAAKSLVEKNGEEISTLTESNEMKDKRIAELEAEVERLNTKLKEDEVKMLLSCSNLLITLGLSSKGKLGKPQKTSENFG